MNTATVNFIGKIRTSYKTVADCPGQARPANGVSRIELDPAMSLALKGIENKSRIQPIFTSFSRSVVRDQCSTSFGKARVRMKLARL